MASSMTLSSYAGGMLLTVLVLMILCCSALPFVVADSGETNQSDFSFYKQVKRKSPRACGEQNDESVRAVVPNFLSGEEVGWLKTLVEKGMAVVQDQRGPTIMDPDLGLVLARGGKVQRVEAQFTEEELQKYGALLRRVHDRITSIHGLDKTRLYHTAPTFIARIAPFPEEESTQHIHDEYWHLHCDKNNTEHYDYSALVYLTDYSKDFEGGQFEFHDSDKNGQVSATTVLPTKGSLITFASGVENAHRVKRVTKGARIAWSLWFTCDAGKRFKESRLKLDSDDVKPEL